MLDFIFRNKGKKEVKSGVNSNNSKDTTGEFILNTFLTLTSRTYPYGFEDDLVGEMIKLKLFPSDLKKDKHGNYFYKIGESRTMFTSHFDTACKDSTTVTHVIDNNYIKTDGNTILGADDKAGVTIMLYMIKNSIPGLYYFFVGEEVGCVGSGLAAKYLPFKGKYDRCVSFDRRSTGSVITHQSSTRCCSDEFANKLAKELNKSEFGLKYQKDDSGIYTDSAEFTSEIPECTNISVGYYKEHTVDESQDIEHLTNLAKSCLVVDWESLVTKRDPSKTEYKSWGRTYGTYNGDYDYGYWGTPDPTFPKKDLKKTYGYHDDYYDDVPKKTRRGRNKNNKKSKSFYDGGDGEIRELTFDELESSFINDKKNHITNKYEWIKFKFLNNSLSKAELEVVKDQYLDMDSPDDRRFYEIIRSYVVPI